MEWVREVRVERVEWGVRVEWAREVRVEWGCEGGVEEGGWEGGG
jgi:hypothetical protein